MNEVWADKNYFVLFAESEIPQRSREYGIDSMLPGYTVIGLVGWDDLLIRDERGVTYTVPCVPMELKYLVHCEVPDHKALQADSRFTGKVKWYVKPIAFGGDPGAADNLIWVTCEEHLQLVAWWNRQYHAIKQKAERKH